MCPDDDHCLCRAWRSAAKVGIDHRVFFDSLRLSADDGTWYALGRNSLHPGITFTGIGIYPAEAIGNLEQRILTGRSDRDILRVDRGVPDPLGDPEDAR